MFNKYYAGWKVVAVTFWGMSSSPGPFAFAALGVFMLSLTESFGWSRAEISYAFTVLTVTTALFSPVLGRIVDKIGARNVLLVSLFFLGVCMLLLGALMTELWHLLAIYGLIGVLAVGSNSLPYMRVLSAWFDRSRGLAIGLGIGGIGLGYAYVPVIIQFAIEHADWRFGFYVLAAIIFFISIPAVWLWFRNSPAEARVSDETQRRQTGTSGTASGEWGMASGEIYRSTVFWRLAGIFVILSIVLNGTLTHLMPLLVDKGIEKETAALAISSVGLMMALSRVLIGYFVDRFFAPHVAVVCFCLSMIGIVIFGWSESIPLIFMGAMMLGFSLGAETDMMAYLVGRYFGLKAFGAAYGALFSAILAGTAVGPLMFGFSYEKYGNYELILMISIALNFIAVVATSRLGAFPEDQYSLDSSISNGEVDSEAI